LIVQSNFLKKRYRNTSFPDNKTQHCFLIRFFSVLKLTYERTVKVFHVINAIIKYPRLVYFKVTFLVQNKTFSLNILQNLVTVRVFNYKFLPPYTVVLPGFYCIFQTFIPSRSVPHFNFNSTAVINAIM
jgi:hypothetical protein